MRKRVVLIYFNSNFLSFPISFPPFPMVPGLNEIKSAFHAAFSFVSPVNDRMELLISQSASSCYSNGLHTRILHLSSKSPLPEHAPMQHVPGIYLSDYLSDYSSPMPYEVLAQAKPPAANNCALFSTNVIVPKKHRQRKKNTLTKIFC